MTTFTRKHYIEIGNTLKKLPSSKKRSEYLRWNKIFKKDNPRYDSKQFKSYIGLSTPKKKTKRKRR